MIDSPKVQFRLNYSELEDRILFTGVFTDGTELNVWFTRRLTFGFLSLARKYSAATAVAGGSDAVTPQVKENIASFERDAAAQQADRSTPFAAGQPHKDLGKEPLLLNRVTVAPAAENTVSLQFGLPDNRLISFPVSRDTFLTLWDMVEELVQTRTGWTISPEPESEAAEARDQPVLH